MRKFFHALAGVVFCFLANVLIGIAVIGWMIMFAEGLTIIMNAVGNL